MSPVGRSPLQSELSEACLSGKTTVGSVLAKSLKYLFMDTDGLIEKAAKCSINEFFATESEEAFRKLETTVVILC